MAPATRIYYTKYATDDGAIVEIVIWALPAPLPGSAHRFKYRLFYGRPGERIVGYDKERGKGDHRHVRGRETAYRFTTWEKLIDDFLADVARAGGLP